MPGWPGWGAQRGGCGRGWGTLTDGIHPVPRPRGRAGHPPGRKLRAGIPRWRVGAMNSFPFMICYDDTPEG